MDRKDGLNRLQERLVFKNCLQVSGNKARLPIVAVYNIRLPTEVLQRFEYAPGKKNEPFVVVLIIFFGGRTLINTIAPEISFIVEKINLNLAIG